MGFLAALARLLGDQPETVEAPRERPKPLFVSGPEPEHTGPEINESGASAYDRSLWVKKLYHLLSDKLPVDDNVWTDFIADAHALGFNTVWVEKQKHAAFEKLVRQAVSDGVLTAAERHQIELARVQIDATEEYAIDLLKRTVAEARGANPV